SVKSTQEQIGAPAISPDGAHVAFEAMFNRNYEIFVVRSDGSGETHISREIQHDRFPRFITNDKVMWAKGEGRHRRSFVYDMNSGETIKLFHNNTVRTIAPEYEWASDADGTRILIQSERDGDTITPERGVYLVDLSRKVTMPELLARIDNNLESERTLRSKGESMFKPIFDKVKAVTENVSRRKIFEYESVLFDFDSKNISQPGNGPAGDYLYETYRSFGYNPEYQWFEPRGIRTANILATLRGTVNPELIYVISSHYDSNQRGPGADDNSSASAVLLETARLLAGTPMPATIIFALFTGEESGLLGSRYFVQQAVENNMKLVGALNNDMIGWAEDHRLDNTLRYSNAGIRDVQHAAAFLFSKMVTYDAHYYKSTDAAAYYEAYGDIVGGIGSYPVLGNPYYHQPTDLLETVNHELLEEAAKANIASIMLLASSPSRLENLHVEKGRRNSFNVSWTPAPERGISHYVIAYGTDNDPVQMTMRSASPSAVLSLPEDEEYETLYVAVRAVNENGLVGWDWVRGSIQR
ncbi:M28 family peptidase, partial [candidate division KSB1 bacterium]